jgi:hypothetical protein
VKRFFLTVASVLLVAAAWALKLFYDTFGDSEKPLVAVSYFPVLAAAVIVGLYTLGQWFPSTAAVLLTRVRNASLLVTVVSVPTALVALGVFGRVLSLIKAGDIEADMGSYYEAPGLTLLALPALAFLGCVAFWCGRRSATYPTAVAVTVFCASAIFILVKIWRFISYLSCVGCSGPAL